MFHVNSRLSVTNLQSHHPSNYITMRETANIQKILPEAPTSQAKHEEPREPFYETKLKSSNHETIRDHFQLFLPFL